MNVVLSSELQVGDIVWTHGMRVLIDQPIKSSHGAYGTVYGSNGKVLNIDDVPSEVVPHSWLYPDKWDTVRKRWVLDKTAEPRWYIQGNDNATWSVETRKAA